MDIKPIRTEADYDKALRRVEMLWDAAAGTREEDELDILATLVDAYEREHYPIAPPSPLEAIKFRLEQSGKTYKDLIGILGQRTRVYEVMRGARPLSLEMIRRLHEQLGIPAEVLIQARKRRLKRQVARSTAIGARGRTRKRA